MASAAIPATTQGPTAPARWARAAVQFWGVALVAPYVLVFLLFVPYPVCYGFWIARRPETFAHLLDDPIFARSAANTLVFLVVGVNLKMITALMLSNFFVQAGRWIQWLAALFLLPWALPSIPTIISIRFMLKPALCIVHALIFRLTGDDGPNWLNDPALALALAIVVHTWKSLPFWTLILISGRLAISQDLYESAPVDGATARQMFRYVTWPSMPSLYLTCP